MTAAERTAIEAVLGPITDDDAMRAVRDGRGRSFQRLEFLGDSVLDVILTVHRWAEPICVSCTPHDAAEAASDLHLAHAASRAGLGRWLEWRASDERIADLVETCVAACWVSGRWNQSAGFVSQVVHPVGQATVRALTVGDARCEPGRAARRVGSALLELAAADGVVRAFPGADEGELSTRRATLHRATAITAIARAADPALRGDPDQVLSTVEDGVAAVLRADGADAALLRAGRFVPALRR